MACRTSSETFKKGLLVAKLRLWIGAWLFCRLLRRVARNCMDAQGRRTILNILDRVYSERCLGRLCSFTHGRRTVRSAAPWFYHWQSDRHVLKVPEWQEVRWRRELRVAIRRTGQVCRETPNSSTLPPELTAGCRCPALDSDPVVVVVVVAVDFCYPHMSPR